MTELVWEARNDRRGTWYKATVRSVQVTLNVWPDYHSVCVGGVYFRRKYDHRRPTDEEVIAYVNELQNVHDEWKAEGRNGVQPTNAVRR